jgi:hypothetical protein
VRQHPTEAGPPNCPTPHLDAHPQDEERLRNPTRKEHVPYVPADCNLRRSL